MIRLQHVLLAFALCCGLTATAHRTIYTNFYLNMGLDQRALTFYLEGPHFMLPPVAHLNYRDPPPDSETYRLALEQYLKEIAEVKIDGLVVNPIVTTVSYEKIPGAMHLIEKTDLLQVIWEAEYPIKTAPNQIAIEWKQYLEEPSYGWAAIADPDQNPRQLDVEFEEYGRYNYFILSPEEPGFTWHAPQEFVETNSVHSATLIESDTGATFPTIPIMIFLVGGLGLIVAQAKGTHPILRITICIGTLGASISSYLATTATQKVPSEPRALEIFETVHQNIYRAFDYTAESDIYDALAQSVDGPLLDRIYTDVYQSLILREEGGAIARVDSVNVTDAQFLGADPQGATFHYRVACDWDVVGKVKHWGHAHARTNRYSAVFNLAPRDSHWRISEMNVSRQERVEVPQVLTEGNDPAEESVWDLYPEKN